jgi:hypothetical protein
MAGPTRGGNPVRPTSWPDRSFAVVMGTRRSDADSLATDPLTPIRDILRHMANRRDIPSMQGIAPDLTVTDLTGWVSATELASGDALDELLGAAQQRWRAAPHAAAALAWKCYSYWLSLPAVLGYATARRVPLLRPGGVVLQWSTTQPFLRLGLTTVEVAVLPSDPILVHGAHPGVRVVPHENALLDEMRTSLMDEHLTPILGHIRSRLHLGRRTLWGSLASGVAHGLSRAADVIPGPTLEIAEEVLSSLRIADLVDLAPRPDDAGLTVQRKTCCLAFTLPEPKICSGCCIR